MIVHLPGQVSVKIQKEVEVVGEPRHPRRLQVVGVREHVVEGGIVREEEPDLGLDQLHIAMTEVEIVTVNDYILVADQDQRHEEEADQITGPDPGAIDAPGIVKVGERVRDPDPHFQRRKPNQEPDPALRTVDPIPPHHRKLLYSLPK